MNKINTSVRRFWGISEVGFSCMSSMEVGYFMFFLTEVAKLPLNYVAIIMGFAGTADAVSAIVAGAVIDKFNLKGGKYRPWLIYCPPVVIVFFMLMFSKVGSDITTLIICSVGYIISHFVWNIAWTANRALIGTLTDDSGERAYLSGRIAAGSRAGGMIASYFVPVMVVFIVGIFADFSETIAYTAVAGIAGVLFCITYFIHYAITKGYDVPQAAGEGAPRPKPVSLINMLKTIVVNPQLMILIFGDILRQIGYFGFAAMGSYYALTVLGNPALVGTVLLIYNLGVFVGSLLARSTAKKFNTKIASLIGTGGSAVLLLCAYFMPQEQYIMYIMIFLAFTFFGIGYGLTSSLYSACGTASEYKTGNDVKGTIMACSSLAIKMAIVIRGIAIPALLAAIAYSSDAEITDTVKNNISAIVLLAPAALSALSVFVLCFFKNNDAEIAQMEKEIVERRTKKA